jgi:hyperosmotically inducible protein
LVTTKVKAKLFDDNILRGVGISVDTFEGNVTLTGAVENAKQIEHATAIVKSVYGVRKVNNLLMIKK